MELIDKLGIDLKLLIAQVVNFGILLFILTKLVYKPILELLDKRKKMIEKNVENTKKIEEQLERAEADRSQIMADASAEAMKVVEKSQAAAEEQRQRSIAETKDQMDQLTQRYKSQLKAEKEDMLRDVKAEVAGYIVQSCEKLVKREFGKEDQKRLEEAIQGELASTK